MKRLITLAIILCAFVCQAQQQVAILNHNGQTLAYFGETSFSSAYYNASDGDVITLSGGEFNLPLDQGSNSVNAIISKNITVRGSGYEADGKHLKSPTKFKTSGVFYINTKTAETAQPLVFENIDMEGFNIYFEGCNDNVYFRRCKLPWVYLCKDNEGGFNVSQCTVKEIKSTQKTDNDNGNVNFYNSLVVKCTNVQNIILTNCNITTSMSNISNITLHNSLIQFKYEFDMTNNIV